MVIFVLWFCILGFLGVWIWRVSLKVIFLVEKLWKYNKNIFFFNIFCGLLVLILINFFIYLLGYIIIWVNNILFFVFLICLDFVKFYN